ncbi:ribonuclease HI [Vibrio maritimus]|uniref:ribonuclease H n=1 Tax=Vibrio maritimus TaxID=990268 RepID=A0A090S5K3_9VIBR|nr:ribonuclease HI [Vibrio maritimus]
MNNLINLTKEQDNSQTCNEQHQEHSQYVVYTDGACANNHLQNLGSRKAGWAAITLINGQLVGEQSGSLKGEDATSNRAELIAAIRGLSGVPEGAYIELFTDSKYVIQCITEWLGNWKKNGWRTANKKPVKNMDLIQELDELYQNRCVHMTWVKGHSGNELNERADSLAKQTMMINT